MLNKIKETIGSGFKLERFKFTVYLLAPILAVVLYSQPEVHETALKSSRYIVYTNPKIPVFRKGKSEKNGTEDSEEGEISSSSLRTSTTGQLK